MKTPYLLQWIAGTASIVCPYLTKKKNNLLVLTSFHGDGYRSNTKYLFEELIHHNEFDVVWATRNKELLLDLKKRFGEESAVLMHSQKGIKTISKAAAILFTHGTSDFPFIKLPRRALKIHTYHGLPTKRGEYLRPKSDKKPSYLHKKILEFRFSSINYFLSSSQTVSYIYSKRFGMRQQQLIETGYPAYDSLINQKKELNLINQFAAHLSGVNKLILYAPTFRKISKTQWFPFSDKNIREIADFLQENNAIMALRPHPNEGNDLSTFTKVSDRFIITGQNEVEDVNQLLLNASVVITDYSSIYIEGLLKEIPCIFIPYDKDDYERGLALPYDKITPGPKVFDQARFLKALEDSIKNPEMHKAERERVKEVFFSQTDGQSTHRVIKFLKELLL